MNDQTHYDTLGIPTDASPEQIKRAFRTLIKVAHTDAGGSDTATHPLNAAYEVLRDPGRRAAYDARLAAPAEDEHTPEEDPSEVVDDWGAEVPMPPRPAAQGTEQPPPPRWHQPPPQPAPWPWEPSYQGPPIATAVRPWHRVWLAGHGGWVWTARILTCLVLTLLLAPLLLSVLAMAFGKSPWGELAPDLLAWAVLWAIVLIPTWHRSMGGKIGWLYGIFVLLLIGVPLLMPLASTGKTSSWAGILAIGLTIVAATEVRHFTITTRRARVV